MVNLKEVYQVLESNFKGKAIGKKGRGCTYFNDDTGKRCVIGCFLSEASAKYLATTYGSPYIEDIDGCKFPDVDLSGLPKVPTEILQRWQYFHDELEDNFTVTEQRNALFNFFVRLCKEDDIEVA